MNCTRQGSKLRTMVKNQEVKSSCCPTEPERGDTSNTES